MLDVYCRCRNTQSWSAGRPGWAGGRSGGGGGERPGCAAEKLRMKSIPHYSQRISTHAPARRRQRRIARTTTRPPPFAACIRGWCRSRQLNHAPSSLGKRTTAPLEDVIHGTTILLPPWPTTYLTEQYCSVFTESFATQYMPSWHHQTGNEVGLLLLYAALPVLPKCISDSRCCRSRDSRDYTIQIHFSPHLLSLCDDAVQTENRVSAVLDNHMPL